MLVLVLAGFSGCNQQVGPPDKTVGGTEYRDLVNQGKAADEAVVGEGKKK